jgi:chorismate synthase
MRYLTAGESHGRCLIAVIEGLPAGMPLKASDINPDLARRRLGRGRGGRMRIESDQAVIVSGVRGGLTLGSPVALQIMNLDWANWSGIMAVDAPSTAPALTAPRPGHADLAGALKYGTHDVRNVLERASARETAARVAVGAVAKRLLAEFGAEVLGHVLSIGGISARRIPSSLAALRRAAEASEVRCASLAATRAQVGAIDRAARAGDSVGGVVEVRAGGLPPGLGSFVQWDRRLDGRLAAALMSIQAFKGVEIGDAFQVASMRGSKGHDGIEYDRQRGFHRRTNRAGGIEGGMTNGSEVVIRAAVKPVSTLRRPLDTVDLVTKKRVKAVVERSDVCMVPAAAVVAEAVVAIELASALQEKLGGDSIHEMKRNFRGYLGSLRRF